MLSFSDVRPRLLLAIVIATLVWASSALGSEQKLVLRGRIDPISIESSPSPDAPLTFVTDAGKKYQVAGDSMSNAQLRDPRLKDREWELRGSLGPNGEFEIVKLFTVKDGKLYRVTYYCEICNIVTHQPGDCMCCQAPTELREIPGE